jgi:hypothetical protein
LKHVCFSRKALENLLSQELATFKAQVRKEIEELKKERLYHWRNYGDIDGSDEYSEGIVENYKDAPDVADGSSCEFVWNEALKDCLSIPSLKEASNE